MAAVVCPAPGSLVVKPAVAPLGQNVLVSVGSASETLSCTNPLNASFVDNNGRTYDCGIRGCSENKSLSCLLQSPSAQTSRLVVLVGSACVGDAASADCSCLVSGDSASGSIFFGLSSSNITFTLSRSLESASFQSSVTSFLRLPNSDIVWIQSSSSKPCLQSSGGSSDGGQSALCSVIVWSFLSTPTLPFAHSAYISTLTSKLSSGIISLNQTSLSPILNFSSFLTTLLFDWPGVLRAEMGTDCWFLESSLNIAPSFGAVRYMPYEITLWFSDPSQFTCNNASLPIVRLGSTNCDNVRCDSKNSALIHCKASELSPARVRATVVSPSLQCGSASSSSTCQNCFMSGVNTTFLWGEPSVNVNFTGPQLPTKKPSDAPPLPFFLAVLLSNGDWATGFFRTRLSQVLGLLSEDQVIIKSVAWCGPVCTLISFFILPTPAQPQANVDMINKLEQIAKNLPHLSTLMELPLSSVSIGDEPFTPTENKISTPSGHRPSSGGDSLLLLKIILPAFGSLAVLAAIFSAWAVAAGLKRRPCFLCIKGDVVSSRNSLKNPCKACTSRLKSEKAFVLLCSECLDRGAKGRKTMICSAREAALNNVGLVSDDFDPMAGMTLCCAEGSLQKAFFCFKNHHFSAETSRSPTDSKQTSIQCIECRQKESTRKKLLETRSAADEIARDTELMVYSNSKGNFNEEKSSASTSPETIKRAMSSDDLLESLHDDVELNANRKRMALAAPTAERLTPLSQHSPPFSHSSSPGYAAQSAGSSPRMELRTPEDYAAGVFQGNKRGRLSDVDSPRSFPGTETDGASSTRSVEGQSIISNANTARCTDWAMSLYQLPEEEVDEMSVVPTTPRKLLPSGSGQHSPFISKPNSEELESALLNFFDDDAQDGHEQLGGLMDFGTDEALNETQFLLEGGFEREDFDHVLAFVEETEGNTLLHGNDQLI